MWFEVKDLSIYPGPKKMHSWEGFMKGCILRRPRLKIFLGPNKSRA